MKPEIIEEIRTQLNRVSKESRIQATMDGLTNELRGLEAVLGKKLTPIQRAALLGVVEVSPELSIGEAYMRVYGKA